MPAGVLNLLTGMPAEIGDALTGHPDLDAISFTGSNPVGRAIQAAAVPRGVKVQLEMGGKNPVIVLPDADLDLAVDLAVERVRHRVASGVHAVAGTGCRGRVGRGTPDVASAAARCGTTRVWDNSRIGGGFSIPKATFSATLSASNRLKC